MTNLKKKKKLIARTLNVGVERIRLDETMKDEIKEAITRQDIKDLYKEGIIKVKDVKGRRKKIISKRRKGAGSIKIARKKDDYVTVTRKLRRYVKNLMKRGKIDREKASILNKRIKARMFHNINHLRQEI